MKGIWHDRLLVTYTWPRTIFIALTLIAIRQNLSNTVWHIFQIEVYCQHAKELSWYNMPLGFVNFGDKFFDHATLNHYFIPSSQRYFEEYPFVYRIFGVWVFIRVLKFNSVPDLWYKAFVVFLAHSKIIQIPYQLWRKYLHLRYGNNYFLRVFTLLTFVGMVSA